MTLLERDRFTAVAMCPHCSSVAVHPFRLPQAPIDPNSPLGKLIRSMDHMGDYLFLGLGPRPPRVRNPPEWASVIRECACGAEWCQA